MQFAYLRELVVQTERIFALFIDSLTVFTLDKFRSLPVYNKIGNGS